MALTLIFYFIFVSFALGFSLVLFKFFDIFMCWVGDMINTITR